MSNFDQFFANSTDESAENFLTPTFTTFEPNKPYLLQIVSQEKSESSMGYYQIQLQVDAVASNGEKESMGRIWVPTPVTIAGGNAAKDLAKPETDPAHKKAKQMQQMFGRFLYSFLRSVAPQAYSLYKLEKTGRRTVAVDANGNELSKDERAIADKKLSQATLNFAQAFVNGAAGEELVGLKFWYKVVPRKGDATKTNPMYLTEDDLND